MKRLLIALLAATAFSPVHAADLPPQAPPVIVGASPIYNYQWTGAYAGVNVGLGTQNGNTHTSSSRVSGFPLGITPPSVNEPAIGILGGGQLGYNYRFGSSMFVLGAEADFDWSGTKNSWSDIWAATLGPANLALTNSGTNKIDALTTERLRFGVLATPQLMLYGTGGLAIGETTTTYSTAGTISGLGALPCAIYCGSATVNGWHTGWTAGAGMEYAINQQWTAKAEWLYYDLGTANFNYRTTGAGFGIPNYNVSGSTKLDGNIARFGVNYKFW